MLTIEECAAGLLSSSPGRAESLSLDDAAERSEDTIAAAAEAIAMYPGVVVGVANRHLTPSAAVLAQACATTVAPTEIGWLGVAVSDVGIAVEGLLEIGAGVPARVLCQVLRGTATMPVHNALFVESLAYSALLGGEDFRAWRAATPRRGRHQSDGGVTATRYGHVLRITLSDIDRRNALDAAARRDLTEALDIAVADSSLRVEMVGQGLNFSSGGDLDEFGTARDPALAHALRIEHGPAPRMAIVGERTTVRMHGPCVGAGVELAAFAGDLVAAEGTTFRLPEVRMGLIPAAGGTVSIPRRIGRWRAAWWMLTGGTVGLDRAAAWGLVDRVE